MATGERSLSNEAFMREVTQRGLDVKGPAGWYLFAGYQGPNGWEVIKTDARDTTWIYQARRVATQGNAGGGAVKIDVAVATGQIARLISCRGLNSGTNSFTVSINDEDNAVSNYLAIVGSAAGTSFDLPTIGANAATSNTNIHSVGLIIPSGAKLTIEQGGAGAQNDTLTVALILELFNLSDTPIWSKSRSTNEADVTLAANTISTANAITAGRLWI